MRLSRTNARACKQVPETEIPAPAVTGPRAVLEAGQRFWNELGTDGKPIRENNTPAGSVETDTDNWDSLRVDLTPGDGDDSDLKHHQIQTTAPVTLRFTNWSAGDEVSTGTKTSCGPSNSTDCEPNNSGNKERWVQITGGDGHGLWNDMSNNKGCTANDRYAVCGYYEEWSTDNAGIRLVDEVELDLSKYREFCNAN